MDSEISEEDRTEDNVSVPSYFMANAHDELYAFYARKGDLLVNILRPIGATVPTPQFESATVLTCLVLLNCAELCILKVPLIIATLSHVTAALKTASETRLSMLGWDTVELCSLIQPVRST